MLEISPFAAIRYQTSRLGGNVSDVLAPPYDVLDAADKERLLRKNSRNIVAIDLPFIPPKSAGPNSIYEDAARTLRDWINEKTLIREKEPAVYVYHQRFQHASQAYTRRMLIARVRLKPFADGVILPHEQTFGGPKEDRLALMKATACNLSPVFSLYRDPENRVGALAEPFTKGSCDILGSIDGVENRLWIVRDREAIGGLVAALADRKLYIADGHHRYGTSLMYRDWVEQTRGTIPKDHPAHYIMMVLASMDDPGCLILPYHRALAGIGLSTLLDAWSPGSERIPTSQADMVVHDGRTSEEIPLRFTHRMILAILEPNHSAAWHQLDVAYLHRFLIDELLASKLGREPKIHYVKSTEDAKRTAREEGGVALLLNATPMAHLSAVSEAGDLMPQKSTYFHPKLATGLTIYPLA